MKKSVKFKNFKLETLSLSPFYNEFWKLKGWKISFPHYQPLISHYKSKIKSKKTKSSLRKNQELFEIIFLLTRNLFN
jgi:hypothetical protein